MQKVARPAVTAHVPRLRPRGRGRLSRRAARTWRGDWTSRPACRSGCHRASRPGIVQLEWCASFNGPARAQRPRAQVRRRAAAGRAAGRADGRALARAPASAATCSCRCPSTPQKRRQRGFDQAELLARGVGASSGIPVVYAVAARRAKTTAQHQLGRRARAEQRGSRLRRRAAPRARRCAAVGGAGRRRRHERRDARRLRRGALRGGRVSRCRRLTLARER